MCRPEAPLYASHPFVAVSSPPHQHLSEPVDWHVVALLGVVVVVALLHGTAVVARRCEAQRLEVLGRGLNPAQNTSPEGVGMRSVIVVVVEVAARRT